MDTILEIERQYVTPYERRRPHIIAFVGFPGMGKSTQATTMSTALGVPRLRLGRYIKNTGINKTPEEADSPLLWYQRLLQYTQEYLRDAIAPCAKKYGVAILDGFPRGPHEAEELYRIATRENFALTLLHFNIPNTDDRINFSLNRQRSRAVALARTVNDTWYQQKIELAIKYEISGVDRASELGVRIVSIDPRESLEKVNNLVRKAIRLDFERLSYDRKLLSLVSELAPEAFVVGGHFYRPFFNGIYGPKQEPWNVGVAVENNSQADEVRTKLEAAAPQYRWRVGNAVEFTERKTGLRLGSLEDALGFSHNLIGISGGVKLRKDGCLQVVLGESAEPHLRRGILQPSAYAKPEDAVKKAKLLVQDYPGLSAPFIKYKGFPIIPDWATIHEAVTAMEHGGKRIWNGLTSDEEALASQLSSFAFKADKRSSAPPIPKKSQLPKVFPWEAPDAEFREWLLHELRDPVPSTMRDPFLENALNSQYQVPQKPTHQGWATHQHAAMTLLGLETDNHPEYRRALRVAALLHDVGKKRNVGTPGAHSRIGAKQWSVLAPEWLSDDERKHTTYFIENHDILGRLSRGVKEPEYQGAVDPAHIRNLLNESGIPPMASLELILALNKADVGSVASLRWTLPELELAARMVESGF